MTATKGIIFDMDGVLCDSEPFILEAAVTMFRTIHGCKTEAQDFEPFVGAGEDRYLGGVAEKYGVSLDMPKDKIRTYEIYLDKIKGRLTPLPGIHDFVGKCRKRGIRLAVATSADQMKMEGNLRELGLQNHVFDTLVFGEMVKRKKPFPDIFLMACEQLALTPAQCIVFEDAPNGIAAACAAGCRAFGITSSFSEEKLIECGATWTAATLTHIPQAIFSSQCSRE